MGHCGRITENMRIGNGLHKPFPIIIIYETFNFGAVCRRIEVKVTQSNAANPLHIVLCSLFRISPIFKSYNEIAQAR